MSTVLTIKKEVSEGTRELLRSLLTEGKVRGVLCLVRGGPSGAVRYGLTTDPDKVREAVPFHPVMPNNAAKLLSAITAKGPAKGPIAAVLRPCELRAFVELVKRRQADQANIVTISATCPGVLPLKSLLQGEEEKLVKGYWSATARIEPLPTVRNACKRCEHFAPWTADFAVSVAGGRRLDTECRIFLLTERAVSLCEGIDAEWGDAEMETAETKRIRESRRQEGERLSGEMDLRASGLDKIIGVFSSCVGCRICRSVCPICYCRRCEFDAPRWEYTPEEIGTNLRKRGGIRLPPGTVNFHLGRLIHMGISCVGCGMCTDVCPADIPVSEIFTNTGQSVQKMFDYLPGGDPEAKIPVTTFKEDEFSEVER